MGESIYMEESIICGGEYIIRDLLRALSYLREEKGLLFKERALLI